MTGQSYAIGHTSRSIKRLTVVGFQPGGWGDRLVFGYMFRVVTALIGLLVPTVVVFIWAGLANWQLSSAMLWFLGGTATLMICTGEALRIGVYEARLGEDLPLHDERDASQADLAIKIAEHAQHSGLGYTVAKRILDLLVVVPLLIMMLPIFVMIAALIRFDTPGPIFVRYARVGYRGRTFAMLKFRTLAQHGSTDSTGSSDYEITRVGRLLRSTSLDEIPQFLNVLSGDMSLIGPRPSRVQVRDLSQHVQLASATGEDLLLQALNYVKPGCSGIPMRGNTREEALIAYLKNRSVLVDMQIFFRTLSLAFKRAIH